MNYDRWKHLLNGNDLEPMDWRHVRMINAVVESEHPGSVLNIGIANGFSASATIEYLESHEVPIGMFVDKNIRPCFNEEAEKSPADKRMFFRESDSAALELLSDCWIIDGCHKEGAIKDYENAKRGRAQIIIAHDTSEDWAADVQFGSIEIGRRMRKDSVTYFEDRQKRHKEHTHRGLIIAFYYQPKPETIDRLKELANYENPFQ